VHLLDKQPSDVMGLDLQLLAVRDVLTPVDNQTHRRYAFAVPRDCTELHLRIRYTPKLAPAHVANLLTISLDDAEGTYRGAGHRHANDQRLALGLTYASPGLVAGQLPGGSWVLTLSVHTLVSPRVSLSIQIGAEMASARP
jgi:hypothetical protein